MAESKKNHLNIDGAQVKEDEHVASYKPIPENDGDFRTSKTSLKKEKSSGDEAEEKLLAKEEEAKIVTRVDMADAKYVVEDHRNGDAKIELDANKRQFAGLTKEELMKYADDPFWVRLRWFMFVLFWAMWFCMLAGAVAIIIRAPKCAPPAPRTWYQKGPIVDLSSEAYSVIEKELPLLQSAHVEGIFAPSCEETYAVLEDENISCLQQFKALVTKAKTVGVKVIVDLTANFVPTTHSWFRLSANRTEPYDSYFTWKSSTDFDSNGQPNPPNNWRSTLDESAWTYHEQRGEFYLSQHGARPDLNFHNPAVVKEFDAVLKLWMKAGADGVRLHKARTLLVNMSLSDEEARAGRAVVPGAVHSQRAYWMTRRTADQPELDGLLAHWAYLVDSLYATPSVGESVFTLAESTTPGEVEWFLLDRNSSSLRPPSTSPFLVRDATAAAAFLDRRLDRWPMIQLTSDQPSLELAAFSTLLPAAPVWTLEQIQGADNDTALTTLLSSLSKLRLDASVQHGAYNVSTAPAHNHTHLMLLCLRWKAGHTGYVSVYNPGRTARASLAAPALPDTLTVHYITDDTRLHTNYTNNMEVRSDDVLVPANSALLLSFVPKQSVEE